MRGVMDEETRDLVKILLELIEAAYIQMNAYQAVLNDLPAENMELVSAIARDPKRIQQAHAHLLPAFQARTVSETKAALLRAIEIGQKPN